MKRWLVELDRGLGGVCKCWLQKRGGKGLNGAMLPSRVQAALKGGLAQDKEWQFVENCYNEQLVGTRGDGG